MVLINTGSLRNRCHYVWINMYTILVHGCPSPASDSPARTSSLYISAASGSVIQILWFWIEHRKLCHYLLSEKKPRPCCALNVYRILISRLSSKSVTPRINIYSSKTICLSLKYIVPPLFLLTQGKLYGCHAFWEKRRNFEWTFKTHLTTWDVSTPQQTTGDYPVFITTLGST